MPRNQQFQLTAYLEGTEIRSLEHLAQATGIDLAVIQLIDCGDLDADQEYIKIIRSVLPEAPNSVFDVDVTRPLDSAIVTQRGVSPENTELMTVRGDEVEIDDLISYVKPGGKISWIPVHSTGRISRKNTLVLVFSDDDSLIESFVRKNQQVRIARPKAK